METYGKALKTAELYMQIYLYGFKLQMHSLLDMADGYIEEGRGQF